ncbi:hypothetical protein H1R20_g12213, partial [Candolleomyces eurysporus]
MVERITLYSAKICPWAHRTELALKESGLDYKRFEVDLENKPEWYAPKVNPASKVPALAYGGPDTEPDSPSPESVKLAESYVLIEFIADLVSSTKPLLPSSPVARARARFFVEAFTSKFTGVWFGIVQRGDDPAGILPAIETLQDLLPAEGYAVGEWSIADAAVTPFLGRANAVLKNDLGAYDQGKGSELWETLQNDAKYERFRRYFADVTERESFKETFFEDVIVEAYKKRFAPLRAQRSAAAS